MAEHRDERYIAVDNAGVATQVANPNRTTRRSIFQLVIAIASAAPIIVPIILGAWSPEWLVAALGQVLAVHGVVTRIMAIPGVNEWIVTHAPWLAPVKIVN